MVKEQFKQIALKKAMKSICRYKMSAIGLNNKGEVIFKAMNRPRFVRYGGGVHAEMEVMLKGGPSIKQILICRVNKTGNILPIEPCPKCANKARDLGIRITSII